VSNTSTPPADTTSPSVPQSLTLNSTSDTQVTFSWTASTDNVGVTGYDVARNNVFIGQSTTNAFVDRTTSPGMTYQYTVMARDANGNVSAWSAPLQFTTSQVLAQLNVSISGKGAVVSTPNGINCPTQSCSANYTNETLLTLTAIAENGWKFSGWSGSCTGTGPCSIALTENRTVNANFSKVRRQKRIR
jgi:chitodextrinase